MLCNYKFKKHIMEEQKKNQVEDVKVEAYERPLIEIIEMEMEGILCGSGDNLPNGGGIGR